MARDHVFPHVPVVNHDGTLATIGGLTLRQYYAGIAMQGILAQRHADLLPSKEIAARAWMVSDALLAELAEEKAK